MVIQNNGLWHCSTAATKTEDIIFFVIFAKLTFAASLNQKKATVTDNFRETASESFFSMTTAFSVFGPSLLLSRNRLFPEFFRFPGMNQVLFRWNVTFERFSVNLEPRHFSVTEIGTSFYSIWAFPDEPNFVRASEMSLFPNLIIPVFQPDKSLTEVSIIWLWSILGKQGF